jgi:hypothetical protein
MCMTMCHLHTRHLLTTHRRYYRIRENFFFQIRYFSLLGFSFLLTKVESRRARTHEPPRPRVAGAPGEAATRGASGSAMSNATSLGGFSTASEEDSPSKLFASPPSSPKKTPSSQQATGGKTMSPKERAAAKKAAKASLGSTNSSSRTGGGGGGGLPKRKAAAEPAPVKSLLFGVGGLAGLKEAFSKAQWGISIAKAFAPKMELDRRNRVRVGVRFRPMNQIETKRGDKDKMGFLRLETKNGQVTITNPKPPAGQEAKTDYYAYDQLYSADTSTKKVFEDLALPLVQYLIAGFNGTIFAYGQTGSGKTHSIMGTQSDPGVVPHCCESLVQMLHELDGSAGSYTLRASYLQIYREVLHDLLSSKSLTETQDAGRDHKNDLRIHRGKTGIWVENLTEVPLTDAATLTRLIDEGNKKRATSSTLMNAASSRSHAVVILSLTRNEKATATRTEMDSHSKLHLVDLAGSERVVKSGATGESLKEAIAINQSLSMLGTVINALTDPKGSTHIPYRSSKLTFLLEDSLGGNSHTVMLAACSPSARSYFETMNTLQYAARAKLIVCDPKANIKGGKEDEAAEAARAADDAKSKKKEKKVFDYLPKFIRTHNSTETHGPRRTWLTGEEKREAALHLAPGGSPPRMVHDVVHTHLV